MTPDEMIEDAIQAILNSPDACSDCRKVFQMIRDLRRDAENSDCENLKEVAAGLSGFVCGCIREAAMLNLQSQVKN